MRQAALDILAAPVEPRQRLNGEAVSQVVDTRASMLSVPDTGLIEQS